jgi:hypothetical protein
VNFEQARQRYFNDVVFNHFVDSMVKAIEELNMAPGEMRQAAVFAELLFHERRGYASLPCDGAARGHDGA